jgi:enoyl-CoA hydratase/carnithine racemase
VAKAGALVRAHEIARELAAKPARALAEAKALIKNRAGRDREAAAAHARHRFLAVIRDDPDAERLMRAFLAAGEDINAP